MSKMFKPYMYAPRNIILHTHAARRVIGSYILQHDGFSYVYYIVLSLHVVLMILDRLHWSIILCFDLSL